MGTLLVEMNSHKRKYTVVAIVQLLSCMQDSAIPWTAAHQAVHCLLSSTVSWSLLKFTSTESVMLSNHLTLCCLLFLLPSIFPSIKILRNIIQP